MTDVMKTIAGLLIACLVAAGCVNTMPPPELRDARRAYTEAVRSPGAQVAPTDVYEAKKALIVAEKAYADFGDDYETRDLAYVAERKAIIAESRGRAALLMQQREKALREAEQWKRSSTAR